MRKERLIHCSVYSTVQTLFGQMNTFSRVACCNSVRIHTLPFVIFHLLCTLIIFLELVFSLIKDYYYYYYLRICCFLLLLFMLCLSCVCFCVFLCCIYFLSLSYVVILLCNKHISKWELNRTESNYWNLVQWVNRIIINLMFIYSNLLLLLLFHAREKFISLRFTITLAMVSSPCVTKVTYLHTHKPIISVYCT